MCSRGTSATASGAEPLSASSFLLTGEQEARPTKENNAGNLQHFAFTAARKYETTGAYLSKISQRHQHAQESRQEKSNKHFYFTARHAS
jgi:hypothetical protein